MIIRADQLLPSRPLPLPAAIALLLGTTVVALLPGLLVGTPVDDRLAFTPFLLSSAIVTFYLGWRWGAAAAVAGLMLGLWLQHALTLGPDIWGLAFYILMALVIVNALHMARWALVHLRNERRTAEKLEMVSHELSHRIQNIFAITISLVQLSARDHPPARAYADVLLSRLDALGRAHNLIRPHSVASASLHEDATLGGLLATLFAPYQADGGDRIAVTGDDIGIGPASATPLALLFHELATNSVKYGALSTIGGRVEVLAARTADALQVVWRETGGPAVAGPPGRTGFGTRLATMSVEKQLGGALRYDWSPHGLSVSLTLPIASLA